MVGHAVEYAGETIEALSMENRMTICNMTIEGGGRAGMIAPDETTFEWVEGRPRAPADFDAAVARVARAARPTTGAEFDTEVEVDAACALADGHLGHEPRHGRRGHRRGAGPGGDRGAGRPRVEPNGRSRYMDLEPGTPMQRDRARPRVHRLLHQLADRGPARGGRGGRRPQGRRLGAARWSCPAPQQVKAQAEAEGLDEVFRAAGFDWREAGCSMCLGMNPDILSPGERCASTSNRNFEGRQGKGGRTHLVSPKMAAAAAIEGRFVDIREWS